MTSTSRSGPRSGTGPGTPDGSGTSDRLPPGVADALCARGEGAMNREGKLGYVAALRARGPVAERQLDELTLGMIEARDASLAEVREKLAEIAELHRALTAPPWHEAVFMGLFTPPAPRGGEAAHAPAGAEPGRAVQRAVVVHGGSRLVVALSDDVDAASLRAGDVVFLSEHRNVILARSPAVTAGETVEFDRSLDGNRIVVRHRDEDLVVEAAGDLSEAGLQRGDLLVWNRAALVAYEKIERTRESEFILEETPSESFESIGGLDEQIEAIKRPILLQMEHSEIARRYSLPPLRSLLLVGPPGTGKTMLARATANWLGTLTPSGEACFMYVSPGQFQSMWYGQSAARVREAFRVARERADRDPGGIVVVFLDEVDSVAAARRHGGHRADRDVLLALSAELNGLIDRGNVLVVAATNRREDIDACMDRAERLGDLVVEVPRPGRDAAREILARHLECGIPYAPAGGDTSGERGEGPDARGDTPREVILDTVVSRIFAPNGEGDLATIVYRDGRRRGVRPADLISGATLASIARKAKERACAREVEQGVEGLRVEDVLSVAEDELETAARILTPFNCRSFVSDLPLDIGIADVQRPVRHVRHAFRSIAVP